MSGSDNDKPGGYGKPPRAKRFQPGQSGNPRGRPRKRAGILEDFRDVMAMPVTITEGGRKRKVSTAHAVFAQMRAATVRGDVRMTRMYVDLMLQFAPEQVAQTFSDLLAEDERLLAEHRKNPPANDEPEADDDDPK